MIAFVLLEIAQDQVIAKDECIQRLTKLKNVIECYHVYGSYDMIVKAKVKDSKELSKFVLKKIREEVKIKRSNTLIVAE